MRVAMGKLSVRDLPVSGKRVLVRVDFNVPLDEAANITDDTRIRATLPTLRLILEKGGKPILLSHLGRPKGHPTPALSLLPCATRLRELLKVPVKFATDAVGAQTEQLVSQLVADEVLLLENLRFHIGEEHPDREPGYVDGLARHGDCYVNDAFGSAHRAHASIVPLAHRFPKAAAMGLLMESEVNHLSDLLLHPKRPFIAIVGGAKVSSKVGVLKSLHGKADQLLIGGGMAYTFLKARGVAVGKSLVEKDFLETAADLLKEETELVLPDDVVVAEEVKAGATFQTVTVKRGVPNGWAGVDIGAQTLTRWESLLNQANTIFWNGPVGVFEIPEFAKGTFAIARLIARTGAVTVVGGGDSVAAVNQAGVAPAITHLSTGGGATLEFLEHGTLPGVEALSGE
jgi:phosphoglycerate kinase